MALQDYESALQQLDTLIAEHKYASAHSMGAILSSALGFSDGDQKCVAPRSDSAKKLLLNVLLRYGRVLAQRGYLQNAERAFNCVQFLLESLRNATDYLTNDGAALRASVLFSIGQLLREAYRLDRALATLQDAKELFAKTGNDAGVLDCDCEIAMVLAEIGRTSDALSLAAAAKVRMEHMDVEYDASRILNVMGLVYSMMGDAEKSRECLHQSGQYAARHSNPREEITSQRMLADLLTRKGELQEAFQMYNDLLERAVMLECPVVVAQVYYQMSYNRDRASDLVAAVQYCEQHQAIVVELERSYDISKGMLRLASTYTTTSDFERSATLLQKALTIRIESGLEYALQSVYLELGSLYYGMRDNDKCYEYYVKAYHYALRNGNQRSLATADGNLGIALLELGRPAEAIVRMKSAAERFTEMGVVTEAARHRMNAGVAHIALDELNESFDLLTSANATFAEKGMLSESANALMNLGRVFSSKTYKDYNPATAERYLLDSIALSTKVGVKHRRYKAHSYMADLYYQEERWHEFAEQYQQYHQLERDAINEGAVARGKQIEQQRALFEFEKQRELVRIVMAQQAKEVETAVRELLHKNELLAHALTQVKELQQFVRGNGLNILDQLSERMERNMRSLDDVHGLREQWAAVHADFIHYLQNSFPSLTESELRIAALLRMKLSSSSIASALFVSKRTVDYHRLNIRKKLALGDGVDLAVYFATLRT